MMMRLDCIGTIYLQLGQVSHVAGRLVCNSCVNVTDLLVLELVHIWSALNVSFELPSVLESLCRHVHALSGKRRCFAVLSQRRHIMAHTFNFTVRDTYMF